MIPNCKKVIITDSFPIGAVVEWWSEDTVPQGWLLCNGQTLNKSDYPDLYKAIGDIFTTTPSETTFDLPNHSGRTPVGVDKDDADFNTVGAKFGEKYHTLTLQEMPSHKHRLISWRNPSSTVNTDGRGASGDYAFSNCFSPGDGTTGYNDNSPAILANGGSKSHNNTQPSIAAYFIIKAKQITVTAAQVVDSLDSEDDKNALSANQGKILNDKIEELKNSLLDLYHPIGSYYETSVAEFNPNTEWGGTWVKDTKGLSTVGAYDSVDTNPNDNSKIYLKQGETTGEARHTLTVDELAKHKHKANFTLNNMGNAEGRLVLGSQTGSQGTTSGNYGSPIADEGNDQPHNNTQPSIGVYRWHRVS